MQYSTGSVSVVNGSNIVTGNGTKWLNSVSGGNMFLVTSDNVTYEVSGVTDDTHLQLTTPYAGTNKNGATYAVVRDFTPNYGLPYPETGDIGTAQIFKRAMLALDNVINEAAKGSTIVQSVTLATPPVSASTNQTWVIPVNATGAWANRANYLATWNNEWIITAPGPGNRIWVLDQSSEMVFNGQNWVHTQQMTPSVQDLGLVTSALVVDAYQYRAAKAVLGGNGIAVSLSHAGALGSNYLSLALSLTQDSSGNRTVTWPSNIRWQGGWQPSLQTSPGATDIVVLTSFDGGQTWGAAISMQLAGG